ncbi:MAG: hypothetical protein KatS3mg131_2565 [Candidatus Tectimicrobiota bacterium]|nr:MAG: hypothetical protein KatS3mg131_2565 [Candidatus Tectomicrobia bacterium]
MDRDYRLLVAFVRRVQRGLYGRRLLQGGVLALTVLLAVLLLGAGVQLLLPLVPVAALFYSGLALLVLVATALYVVWPAVRPVRLRQAVVETEKAYPELHDDLTNALELDPQALARHNPYGMALDLVRALHRHTARRVQQLSAQAVVRRQPLLGLPWCGLLLVATALVALLQPTLLTGALQVGLHPWEFLAMRRLEIRVAPQHAVVARGTNVEVTATVQGRVPRRLFLVVKREGEADKRYPMEAAGDGIFRYLFVKPQNSFTFQAEARGVSSPPGRVEVVPAPAVGHLVLQYRFPAYTGLAPRTQEGGGDIQALPGTQVQLRLRTNVPVVKGVLRFADGSQLPLQIAETTLQGEILVTRDGAYTIEVEDRHGLRNPQPPRYQVQVIPDRVPTVAVRFPPDGAEVDETTVLHVEYTAEDDFGLQDAALVYFGADGVERRISLHPGRFAHPRVQETFSWDMQQWPLPAGDTVQFYVEVYDNDTISGPKRGVSPTQTLKVRNRQQEHEELQGLQERLAEAFLDLLADHLEQADRLEAWQARLAAGEPPSPQALEEMQAQPRQALAQVQQLAQQLAEALDRVQNDPYSTYETYANLRAMQRNLEHLQQSLLPRLQAQLQPLTPQAASPSQLAPAQAALEETIRELERLATLAEQTTHAEKLHDLAAISNKLLEEQNRLLSALNDLPPDFRGGELPPELQALLDRLEDLMQQLAQAVSQLPASLPDEFLNRQLETLPLQELLPQLQELRQKLAAGDLEGARQLAEALLKTLSAMVAALQNMQQQARGGPMEAMQQQLQTSANKLNELIQRQERLLDQTQRIDQQALQQLNQAQRQAYAETQRRLEAQLRALSQLAWDLVQQAQRHPELDAAFRQAYQQLLKQLHTLQRQLEGPRDPRDATGAASSAAAAGLDAAPRGTPGAA